MKVFARNLMGSSLGLILFTAAPSFATVVGDLYTGGTGTVTVTSSGITFTENNTEGGGSTAVGVGTTVTFSGGSLTPGDPIDIAGGTTITPASLPVTDFMTFPNEPTLSVTLDSVGPGSSNTDCSGLTTGQSCSPLIDGTIVSPIILTYTGPGTEGAAPGDVGTTALLTVSGTASDGTTPDSTFNGHFSASLADETPQQLADLFNTPDGASFTTTYAGAFTVTSPSAVPEPRTISVVAIAGLLMGLVVAKRRKNAEA